MSGWVVGLGLAAGYLVNKNVAIKDQLDQSIEKFNSAAKPATGGVTSAEVRATHRRVDDHTIYGDMNAAITRREKDELHRQQTQASDEVARYESGEGDAQIRGVMLQFDSLGV